MGGAVKIARRVFGAVFIGACLAGGARADGGAWRVAGSSSMNQWLDLPPLASVQNTDDSGTTWRLSGELPGNLPVARREFGAALRRQGWRGKLRIPLDRGARKAELVLWSKADRRVLLMLWDTAPGRCGFSIGEEGGRAVAAGRASDGAASGASARGIDREALLRRMAEVLPPPASE